MKGEQKMKKKKVIVIFIVIILLLAIVIGCTQNNINISNTDNIVANDNQTSENSENIEEINTENSIANSEETIEEGSENMTNQSENIKINLIVNNKTFSATLNNNETVKELISMFPMTLHMSDLNANEKYHYLDSSLVTNSSNPRRINAGDIKLYGNNCLVVFYDSFSTSYSYTDLGKVDDVEGFVSELGRGDVTITFELAN